MPLYFGSSKIGSSVLPSLVQVVDGVDISDSTVTPPTLVSGIIAHDKTGAKIVGENPYELNATNATIDEQADLITQIADALVGKARPITTEEE